MQDDGKKATCDEQTRPIIDVGWLVPHQLDKVALCAVMQGRDRLRDDLQQQFDQFEWRMPLVQQPKPVLDSYQEPVLLLEEGRQVCETHHWDMVFVLTSADFHCYYRPTARAVSSQTLNGAAISLSRLAPERLYLLSDEEYIDLMAQRLHHLGMHLLGDLLGLSHQNDPESFMYLPDTTADLDQMTRFTEDERQEMAKELAEIADIRLEEQADIHRVGWWNFYVRAIWIGRDDIYRAICHARPWEFPFRLSGLMTTAVSSLVILLITAETWELGMSQSPLIVGVLTLLALAASSLFILKRQKLLLSRSRRKLTEQIVYTNVAVIIVVFLGMLTTYLVLFTLALVVSLTLYNQALVGAWAKTVKEHSEHIWPYHYVILAGFVASLGILIGSLGASFENQYYFRHITYVDEET